MGKKLRPLEFYGYDYDSTMVKKDENEKDECFQISKVKELKNKKYIKPEEEESESGTTENNG
jgi:hypothetical protein